MRERFANRSGSLAILVLVLWVRGFAQGSDSIAERLQASQRDLAADGRTFLLDEASPGDP